MKKVTAENLNDVMEFDHVIQVHADGTVTEPRGIYAPYYDYEESETAVSDGWELLRGWTGQYSYNGPVMHASEYIGGGLAEHILETPGYWVAMTAEVNCVGTDEQQSCCSEESGCDCFPAGWVIAFKPAE